MIHNYEHQILLTPIPPIHTLQSFNFKVTHLWVEKWEREIFKNNYLL